MFKFLVRRANSYELVTLSLERNKDYCEPWCNNSYCTPESLQRLGAIILIALQRLGRIFKNLNIELYYIHGPEHLVTYRAGYELSHRQPISKGDGVRPGSPKRSFAR
jgi:hypothetical protein